ncbi:MAG: ABC transporter ATP-binding protein [Roseburia sp.]|nr:ABC transporter ATP-binding protein [Anaeroplasma bactoclasticum]MCM1195888.1 ABC transporter ATP-binding protein [Roseburia sp.]MCM1556233.1 ABC transporter ATP-binding protein [Anaeroplasma bactoclasticum]
MLFINLYKKYETKEEHFELNMDLEIPNPSFVVITGESGSGKSTFAKILAGIILMDSGSIKIDNKDISSNVKKYVEYLEANEPLINNFTIYQTLYAKCYHLYNETEVEEKIENICSSLKLTNLKNQKIIDLSGGEAQRVAVGCMMLSTKPILILDEATHSLDEKNSNIIVNMLKEVKNKIVIYITHKSEEVEGVQDISFRFENGKIVDRKVVRNNEDIIMNSPFKTKTRVFPLVKFNFLTGIKGHIQTAVSYLLLFFLCSCFLAIGTFVTSINNESLSGIYSGVYYEGSDDNHCGVCGEGTKYNVEVHSSFSHPIYSKDIVELKEKFGAVDAIENIFLRYYEMIEDVNENEEYKLQIAPLSEKDILAGRIYKKEKEVVISIGETQYNTNQEYFKSFIGKKYGEYSIVGIIQSPHDSMDSFYLDYYASKADLEAYLSSKPVISSQFYFYIDDGLENILTLNEKGDFNCVIDNTLPDDTIATSKISSAKRLTVTYINSFQRYSNILECEPSKHLLAMNEATFKKYTDENAIACTRFYFNTFKECQIFINHLKNEGISYSMYYHKSNTQVKILCYLAAIILIIGIYFIIGLMNRKINRNRDFFYNKCDYNKKKLWLAKIISSTILALISILIYAFIYASIAQVKYVSVITYYALRWMTLKNWFILASIALILHICIESLLQFIPRKKLR